MKNYETFIIKYFQKMKKFKFFMEITKNRDIVYK